METFLTATDDELSEEERITLSEAYPDWATYIKEGYFKIKTQSGSKMAIWNTSVWMPSTAELAIVIRREFGSCDSKRIKHIARSTFLIIAAIF